MVRALGTSGKTRSPILPDVPTLAEAGVPDFQATLWVGFMAPKNTPQPIIDLLNRQITKIHKNPQAPGHQGSLGEARRHPITMPQAEFTAFMEAKVAKWAKVIKANHIALIE